MRVAFEPTIHRVDLAEDRVHIGQLRTAILESQVSGKSHLWMVNTPMGLPRQTLVECGIELEWLAAAEWMASFGSAREWRRAVRRTSRREPRRLCDVVGRARHAPMNLRMFKRTWSTVVELLLPLAKEGVRIAPVSGEAGAKVVVAEARSGGDGELWSGPVPRGALLEAWSF